MAKNKKKLAPVEELPTDLSAETETSVELEADGDMDVEQDVSLFLQNETEIESFLPEVSDEELMEPLKNSAEAEVSLEGTELDAFEAAAIEEQEFVEEERLESIIESILFASDRPVSLNSLKMVFKGTNIRPDQVRRALEQLAVEYAGGRRGVTLEEVPGGFQLRTKIDNLEFLRRTLKARLFKLSGPALEVLSIVAYKQPLIKSEVDEIRGVESGHLLRALMEKGLVTFEGKSELPGRPMQYGTTKKFLEIFGLRNLKELPTLSQIDELLPEGIGEETSEEKATLSQITDSLAESVSSSYSEGEDELMKIQGQLENISTSTTFFEEEKRRQIEKRDQDKAQNIREALVLGEPVSTRDANWLKRYDEALAQGQNASHAVAETAAAAPVPEENLAEALAKFDAETEETPVVEADAEGDEEESDELLFTAEADEVDEDPGPGSESHV